MSRLPWRLGVDFGTSSTVAVLRYPDGSVSPLLFDSSPLLPSGVSAGPGGQVLAGADAARAVLADPAGYDANPKRRIDDTSVWLGEQEMVVPDLIAAVLSRVAGEARRVAGGIPPEVVLTHPAAWGHTRLGVLADAARRAGLGTVTFVAEPAAAAAYFAAVLGREIPPGRCLVVYDLGAGTADVTVVRRVPGGFEVAATDGLADVGGLDLDGAVVDHARAVTGTGSSGGSAWRRLDEPASAADRRARQQLWAGARAAKEMLSRHTVAGLHVPLLDADIHVTRDEFERAARPHLDRTVELTLSVLRCAGVAGEAPAGVLLVGGSSRTPLVASLLHRALRVAPTAIDQPELVVAVGSLHTPAPPRPGTAPPVRLGPVVPLGPAGPRDLSGPLRPVAAGSRSGRGSVPAVIAGVAGVAVLVLLFAAVAGWAMWPDGPDPDPAVTTRTGTGATRVDPSPTAGALSAGSTAAGPAVGLGVRDAAANGAEVTSVTPGGPGATAGFRSGDVIIQVYRFPLADGSRWGMFTITTAQDFVDVVRGSVPGMRLSLIATRNAYPVTLALTVGTVR